MTKVSWLDELETKAWRSLLSAHSRLISQLDADLQASQGISVSDYGVLVNLSEAESGRMRMSELAERLLLSPSGLTRRIDGLVKAGLVSRVRCPSDRRGAYAVLTKAGRKRLERAAPDHVDQVRRHFVNKLTRSQLQVLGEALHKVTDTGCCPG